VDQIRVDNSIKKPGNSKKEAGLVPLLPQGDKLEVPKGFLLILNVYPSVECEGIK